ncbi:unnamed protein product [Orchesella dallaii]|uniref:Uncharacterized protein n=1 Tax=Orchesella dallaii TaxID=48710 RepID=A0ABP1Q4H9_9HEXA
MTPASPPPPTPTPIPKPIEVQQDPVQIPKEPPPPEAPKPELEKILEKPAKPITYGEFKSFYLSEINEMNRHIVSHPDLSFPSLELPYNLDVASIVPTHLVKSIKIKKIKKTAAIRQHVAPPAENDKPPGPIASRVVFLKKPDEPQKAPEEPPAEPAPVIAPIKTPEPPPTKPPEPAPIGVIQPQGPADINGLPMFLVTDTVANLIKITDEDKLIDKRLSELIDVHRGDILKKLKKKKQTKIPTYTYADMMKMLKEQGIPCPTNDDFSRLHGLHSRWDPDFTVLEYFSPMLRTFIPINMRGRYRGCWTTDDCIKGLDISKVAPKREALEGFVQRGRHENTQKKYDKMSAVALDEAHLDYLIEIQSYQAETIPIPIFYDMLHLGMEVANENLRILVEEDGYPPNDVIFMSTEQHAQQLKRKIQLYGALGLETLESKRKGLGQYSPQWLKSRDEVIREIMNRKDNEWYSRLTNMEDEGKVREKARKQRPDGNQQQQESKSKARTSLKMRASFLGKDARKVYPESRTQQKTGGEEGGDGKNEGKKGLLKSQK